MYRLYGKSQNRGSNSLILFALSLEHPVHLVFFNSLQLLMKRICSRRIEYLLETVEGAYYEVLAESLLKNFATQSYEGNF